jgi:hypothetical protein
VVWRAFGLARGLFLLRAGGTYEPRHSRSRGRRGSRSTASTGGVAEPDADPSRVAARAKEPYAARLDRAALGAPAGDRARAAALLRRAARRRTRSRPSSSGRSRSRRRPRRRHRRRPRRGP